MSDYPYSDNIHSNDLDDNAFNDNEVHDVAAGLGLGDSPYRPAGPTHYHQLHQPHHHHHHQQQQQQQQQQPELNEDEALSPSDGYFSRADPQSGTFATAAYPSSHIGSFRHPQDQQVAFHTSQPATVPTSSQVPHIPNVWVPDPSLGPESSHKAREAQEERHQHQYQSNWRRLAGPQGRQDQTIGTLSPPFTQQNPQVPPAPARGPFAHSSPARTSIAPAAKQSYTPASSSSSAAGHPWHSATVYNNRSSPFSDAPPAYTPSPTSPRSSSSSNSNYQTFASPTARGTTTTTTMGRQSESESHGLLAGQTYQPIPQSMGGELDPNEDGHFEYPRPRGWRDKVRGFDWRKHWKVVLLGVTLTIVTVAFLVKSMSGPKKERVITFPDRPESAPIPVVGDDGTRLAYPPYDDTDFANFNTQQCGKNKLVYQRAVFELDFSPSRNVSVFQDIKNDDKPHQGKDVRIDGQVVIRRAGTGTPPPSIVLESASNDDTLQYTADWSEAEQRLYLLTPRSMRWPAGGGTSPCLTLRATIWAPPGSALGALNVDTVHLGIVLLDNLSLRLSEFARLASTVGPIVSATDGEKAQNALAHNAPPASFALDARYIEVKTMSAAISGAWPLYDYLGLETISGSIYAGITPQPVLPEKPLPAVLYVHSTSGTIELFEPIGAAVAAFTSFAAQEQGLSTGLSTGPLPAEALLPPRQYAVDLYSMSGSITAQIAFGFSCKVHTTSGHVDLALLPVMDATQAERNGEDKPANAYLETHTTSGTTSISVLEPLWGDILGGTGMYVNLPPPPTDANAAAPPAVVSSTRPFSCLNARHSATSATLRVTYPASWEGFIDEDSMTGSLSVAGQGVTIVRQGEDYPGIKKHVLARKGDAEKGGILKMHTTSGSIAVVVGS